MPENITIVLNIPNRKHWSVGYRN